MKILELNFTKKLNGQFLFFYELSKIIITK